jgi:predicted nucleotidyltransferase
MEFHTLQLDILSSKTKLKIINFLINYDHNMSEREISSILNVSHMSVNRIMKELENLNFAHFVSVGNAHLWKVNKKSYAYKSFRKFIEAISKIEDPLEDLKQTILTHLPQDLIERIVLFGSVAKGQEKPNSDIDLFILVSTQQHKVKLESIFEQLSILCLDKYGNPLSPYVLTKKEWTEKKNIKILKEIEKGIQLYPEETKT